jgi:phospholipase D1/2
MFLHYESFELLCYVTNLQEEGVKIFVMLFQEVKQALSLNSKYTKLVLMSKHENIKVNIVPRCAN